MDVTVGVATFGDPKWIGLAMERAIPSARDQARTIHRHGATLAEARNAVLADTRTEYIVHLDADDQLEPGYIEAMASGTADLRAPAVRDVHGARAYRPSVPRVAGHRHECVAECLRDGNWLVIGTAVRTQLLQDVGGWGDEAVYEDWSLFARAWVAGATVEAIHEAVYRAFVRSDSRNRAPSMAEKNRVHREIEHAVFGDSAIA